MNRAKYIEFATDVMCHRTWPTAYHCIEADGRKHLKVDFKGHCTVTIHFLGASTRHVASIHVDSPIAGGYLCRHAGAARDAGSDHCTWYGMPESRLEYWLVKACLGALPEDARQARPGAWAGRRGAVPQSEVQGQLWYQQLLSPDGSWA